MSIVGAATSAILVRRRANDVSPEVHVRVAGLLAFPILVSLARMSSSIRRRGSLLLVSLHIMSSLKHGGCCAMTLASLFTRLGSNASEQRWYYRATYVRLPMLFRRL